MGEQSPKSHPASKLSGSGFEFFGGRGRGRESKTSNPERESLLAGYLSPIPIDLLVILLPTLVALKIVVIGVKKKTKTYKHCVNHKLVRQDKIFKYIY